MTTLDSHEYWQLRALSADVDREQAALALTQTRLDVARTRRAALWKMIADKYGLNPDQPYGAVDESCALVDPPPRPAA